MKFFTNIVGSLLAWSQTEVDTFNARCLATRASRLINFFVELLNNSRYINHGTSAFEMIVMASWRAILLLIYPSILTIL